MQNSQHNIANDLETASRGSKQDLRLWLRLLTCSNLIETKVRAAMRTQHAMTLPQFDLMAQLDRAPCDGLTMGELGNRMMVSAGNITGITDRLEREGYVMRVRSNADRRSQNVQMTDRGRAFFKDAAEAHEDWITEMFQGMSKTTKVVLFDRLADLKQSVRAHQFEEDGND